MRIVLRLIAVFVGLAVTLTVLFIAQFVLGGRFGPLIGSGALGLSTIAAWLVILTMGPVAAIQLWRLRRIGLIAATTLCGLALAYYIVGLLFFRAPEAPLRPIFGAIIVNGLLVAFLLSPAARRGVS